MTRHSQLIRSQTGLLLIDVQEKLFPHIQQGDQVLTVMKRAIQSFQILGIPIFVTEQYPQGLGPTIPALKAALDPKQEYWPKTAFSSLGEKSIKDRLLALPITQWVLIGFETHVCVLQTAKSLLNAGKEVVIVSDAVSSRSPHNYVTGLNEMRDEGIRISCNETVVFELLSDSKDAQFRTVSSLFR
jgi:nicotinamidase-related amidase